jgi:hypothetical protein
MDIRLDFISITGLFLFHKSKAKLIKKRWLKFLAIANGAHQIFAGGVP